MALVNGDKVMLISERVRQLLDSLLVNDKILLGKNDWLISSSAFSELEVLY